MHGNGPTEPQLQVVTTGRWCVAKKKGTYEYTRRTPPPMEKKKRGKKKEKKKQVPSTGIDLANFEWIV